MNSDSKMNRRIFLKGMGAAAAAFLVGGGVWRACETGVFGIGEGPAYKAWQAWLTDEGSLALVRAAILAANPDNSQPWLFRVGDSHVDLFIDTARHLAAIDPYKRNMHIGLGCALENLALAAKAKGYDPAINLLPDDSNPACVARVELVPGESDISDLYYAIPNRHMNRGPYESRAVAAEILEALGENTDEGRVFWFATDPERREVGHLLVQATEAVIGDLEQVNDIARWTRASWAEIQQHRDGITLDASGMPPFLLALVKMLPSVSQEQNNQGWLGMTRDTHVKTAAAFGILAVRDRHDRKQQLLCGRLLQRLHLRATTYGLGLHVMHQMVDRAGREESLGAEPCFGNALRELVGDSTWQAVSMFRVGYPEREAPPSPRREIEEVVLK